jgi:hypothetical protein
LHTAFPGRPGHGRFGFAVGFAVGFAEAMAFTDSSVPGFTAENFTSIFSRPFWDAEFSYVGITYGSNASGDSC